MTEFIHIKDRSHRVLSSVEVPHRYRELSHPNLLDLDRYRGQYSLESAPLGLKESLFLLSVTPDEVLHTLMYLFPAWWT